MSDDEPTGRHRLSDRVVELGVVAERLEQMITKLTEINSNLTVLVATHSSQIDTLAKRLDQVVDLNAKRIEVVNREFEKLQATIDSRNEKLIQTIERSFVRKESFDPIQRVLYAMIGLSLTALGGAVLSLVIKASTH